MPADRYHLIRCPTGRLAALGTLLLAMLLLACPDDSAGSGVDQGALIDSGPGGDAEADLSNDDSTGDALPENDLNSDVPADLTVTEDATDLGSEDGNLDLPGDVTTADLAEETTPDTTADDAPLDLSRWRVGCNGDEALCDRAYNEVAYATTHNAMSTEADDFIPPNQIFSITRQLQDGVRGLMLDAHYDGETTSLCHAVCNIGSRPLVEGLVEIRQFLAEVPNAVVTLIFESYVTAEDTALAFDESGLNAYLFTFEGSWPTLQEMIDGGTRLVVFTDSNGGDPAWYHPVWTHAVETHFSAGTSEDFDCDPNRGSLDNELFILNHFLTAPFAQERLAEQVNYNPFFLERALECQTTFEQRPNFVTVDFYSIGDVLEVVDSLNAGQVE